MNPMTEIGVMDVSPDSNLNRYRAGTVGGETEQMPVAQPQMQPADMPVADAAAAGRPGAQQEWSPVQAQLTSYDPILDKPPTPEELKAIGADQPVSDQAVLAHPPSTEELKAIGAIPKTKDDHVEEKGNALLDGIIAAGHEIGSLASGVVKTVGKVTGSQTLTDLGGLNQAVSDKTVEQARASSPIAGAIGKYSADTATALASTPASSTFLGGLAAGAVGGGLTAAATGQGEGTDVSKGAVAGSAIMAAFGVGGKLFQKVLAPIVQGTGMLLKNSDDLVNNVMQAAISKGGEDITKVTPKSFLDQVQQATVSAKATKNALYNARDEYAQGIGAKVTRTGLADVMASMGDALPAGATATDKALYIASKRAVGDGSDISFSKAQTLVSSLGGEANTATRAGDAAKASGLMQIRDTLLNDIKNSTSDSQLEALHGAATNYYRDVYRPVADLKVQKQLVDKYTQDVFVNKLANKVLDNPTAMGSLQTINPDLKNQAIAASVNAIKESSTLDGHLDLRKFGSVLGKEINQNSGAYGSAASDLATYANILSSKAASEQLIPKGMITKMGLVGAGIGGFLVGGLGGLGGLAVADKAWFMHAAGELIDNPAARQLLSSAKTLQQQGNTAMLEKVGDKLMQTTSNITNRIPEGMSRFMHSVPVAGASRMTQD